MEVRWMIERYCPMMGRNVPLEVRYDNEGNRQERCKNPEGCAHQDGSCGGRPEEIHWKQ